MNARDAAILRHPLYRSLMNEMQQHEQTRPFCHHGYEHALAVCRLMWIACLEDGHADLGRDVVYAAGLLHDIGRVQQYANGTDHIKAGQPDWDEILRSCGYDASERRLIVSAMESHHSVDGGGRLGALLRTADRESRLCFVCHAADACHWPDEKKNEGVRR